MVSMNTYESPEAWLKARTSRIGGSDAGCIVGMNKYKDNVQLWKEKTGIEKPEDISEKKAVKYGKLAEEHLRNLFVLDHPELEVMYEDNNMWTNTEYPFAHASLDGWLRDETGKRGILEFKTTEIMNNCQWAEWNGKIPDSYFCQVLHYMAVTGFDFAILVAQIKYTKDGTINKTTREFTIDRADVEADIDYLMGKEKEFFDCIVKKSMPNMVLSFG